MQPAAAVTYHLKVAHVSPVISSWGTLTVTLYCPNSDFCTELKQHCSQPFGLGKEGKHNALNMLAADNIKNMRHSPHRKREMPLLK